VPHLLQRTITLRRYLFPIKAWRCMTAVIYSQCSTMNECAFGPCRKNLLFDGTTRMLDTTNIMSIFEYFPEQLG
jgi:hypothetical protein